MDRFKYCYGKKRGQKVENDARWIALCDEKQKINLEFSDDELSKVEDKENTNHGRRPSRKTFQSNKCNDKPLVFPSRPARPRLDISDSEDCESPNQSQGRIPPKPVPIEDELRKTEDAFANVFTISDDSDDDDDDNNIDDDCPVLDDQRDLSVYIDGHSVVDDYRGDDDDNKSDGDDEKDNTDNHGDDTDDETPRSRSHSYSIAQDSQRAHLVKGDDDDKDEEESYHDDEDCQRLDDQKDPSMDIDKQHVDDYRDDDDKSDATNDQSVDADDETPHGNNHPYTIAQDSQQIDRDDDEEDEESYHDDDDDLDYGDDDDDLDDEDEDTDGVSRSMLSSFTGEESCINSPSTTEFKVTVNSTHNSNDDKDDIADGDYRDDTCLSGTSSFASFHVREAEDVGGYEADNDTHFHGNQTIGIDSTHDMTTSDVYLRLEHDDHTCDDINDLDGESLATSMITDSEDGKDSFITDGNYSGKCDVTISCNTCAEDTSLESYDTDDSDKDAATELCDTCIDKSSATEYSTYAEGTHLESFDSDVHCGDDDDDDDKEEGSDHDSDASDNDASTLCDNSSSTFPDGTDDDPDLDNNDYDIENQVTMSSNTDIDEPSTVECNTCAEESLIRTLEEEDGDDDDDVQSAAEDDDDGGGKEDDGRKEFDSELSNNTCINSRNNSIFSSGTYLGSDDDPSNDYCDDKDVDNDDKIETSDIHGDGDVDVSDDNEEDNDVSELCNTCITLSLSNSAHLESSDSDHGSAILCDTCIDKSDAGISTEVTQSRSIVNDTDVHGDDDDENGELCNTCIGYSTSGLNRTDETRLHDDDDDDVDDDDDDDDDDVDDDDDDDDDDDVKMVINSTHLCGDVSRVKLSSPNHDNGGCDDESYHGNTNASLKDVTTMTSNNCYHASRHSDGEDDDDDDDHIGDDDDDADSNKNEITVLSQPSVLPMHHVSAEDDDDSDNHREEDDDDDDVQEMTCNFNDERNNETIKDDDDDDADKDTTIVLCDGNDDREVCGGTFNDALPGDDDDQLVHNKTLLPNNDIATKTVDRDVASGHFMAADEDDGEMATEDDIASVVGLSIVEASFKRDKRAKRKSSWRVFVGNDNVDHDDDDDDYDDKGRRGTLTRFNEKVVSHRKSVNPRFSIVRVEDDVRRLSESLQALNVRDVNRSLDTYEEILNFCGQKKTLNFANVFTRKWIKSCKKIGEGAYAEVFEVDKSDEVLAIKVIPVRDDGDNGDGEQQSFREILFEMTISRELTRLRGKTDGFVDLRSVWFVTGKYPKVLMEAWDEYDNEKNSENDRPDFPKDQHYVVLGFEMGGVSLENFVLTDHLQVLSIIKQTSLSLAIAEADLSFEHRDLHLGNMLVKSVDRDQVLSFVHLGQKFELQSCGLKVTIIDYTLSRMTRDGCTFFKDLSTDNALFEGQGDIQYDVYRHMKAATGNNWNNFTPATNVLWLKHMVDKILTFAQQCHRSEGHSKALQDIIDLTYNLSKELENCCSACQFVERSSIFSGHLFQNPEGS